MDGCESSATWQENKDRGRGTKGTNDGGEKQNTRNVGGTRFAVLSAEETNEEAANHLAIKDIPPEKTNQKIQEPSIVSTSNPTNTHKAPNMSSSINISDQAFVSSQQKRNQTEKPKSPKNPANIKTPTQPNPTKNTTETQKELIRKTPSKPNPAHNSATQSITLGDPNNMDTSQNLLSQSPGTQIENTQDIGEDMVIPETAVMEEDQHNSMDPEPPDPHSIASEIMVEAALKFEEEERKKYRQKRK
ncbi:hypothetical protein S245_011313 [Arachis hypogaea]